MALLLVVALVSVQEPGETINACTRARISAPSPLFLTGGSVPPCNLMAARSASHSAARPASSDPVSSTRCNSSYEDMPATAATPSLLLPATAADNAFSSSLPCGLPAPPPWWPPCLSTRMVGQTRIGIALRAENGRLNWCSDLRAVFNASEMRVWCWSR